MVNDSAAAELQALWADVDAAVKQVSSYGVSGPDEVEGVRFVTELMRLALTMHAHNNDPDRPLLSEMIGPTLRWGWDNPYTTYHYAPLRGDCTYRIFGRRNTSVYLGITVYGGGDEHAGNMPQNVLGAINDTGIEVAEDGSYEIVLSPEERPADARGEWVQLEGDASSIILRQYFSDPLVEVPATAHIERIPGLGPPPQLTDDDLAQRYANARRYFAAMWGMSNLIITATADRPHNQFFPPIAGGTSADGRPSGYMYPTKDNLYTFGRYEIAADEALVVTVTPPACRYWSFYLGSEFQQSLPYGADYGFVTHHNAALSRDGSVQFVISETDPGVANWLPTQGHRTGVMALRWLLPETPDSPVPDCKLVPVAAVGA